MNTIEGCGCPAGLTCLADWPHTPVCPRSAEADVRRRPALDGQPITIHKAIHYVDLPVDTDGTPMDGDERLVEVAPGQWAHPVALAVDALLNGDAQSPESLPSPSLDHP